MTVISVITCNVSAEFLNPPGVPAWEERKGLLARVLQQPRATLIGLQEVTPGQLQFLCEQLPEFTALTVPVTHPTAELLSAWKAKYARYGLPEIPSPYEIVLFYRTDTLELLKTGHWWLSPTSERPSIGFGNVAPRVVLWAYLQVRNSSQKFLVFNTHIDRRCIPAMLEVCREHFATFAPYQRPLLFIGDLNVNPSNSDFQVLLHDGWRDSYEVALAPNADTFLYTLPDIPGGRIDHILYRGDGVVPRAWMRLISPDLGQRVSDHDPVYAEFDLTL